MTTKRPKTKTKPTTKRPTPADRRRLGELISNTPTTAEVEERERLLTRFLEWAEFRDMSGAAHRDADGRTYAPSTERRLRRLLKVERWKGKRIDAERERMEAVLAAVEDRGSIFARLGELWLVADGGRRAPLLPDRKGMHYIRAILDAGKTGLTPRELCGMVNLLPPGDAPEVEKGENSPTPGTDADGRAIDFADAQDARGWRRAGESGGFRITPEQYAAGVENLKGQLRAAQLDGDHGHARTIRKALRELGEGDPTARTGTRLLPNPRAERMRDAVRRAIERTLREISPHHPAAAAYLDEHVKTVSGRWRYTGKTFTT